MHRRPSSKAQVGGVLASAGLLTYPRSTRLPGAAAMCVADQWLGVCRRKWELQQRDCTGLAPVSLFIALPRGVANRCVGKGKANTMNRQGMLPLFLFFEA